MAGQLHLLHHRTHRTASATAHALPSTTASPAAQTSAPDEERLHEACRLWVNSLGARRARPLLPPSSPLRTAALAVAGLCEPLASLYEDCRDGLPLLKVEDFLRPGVVRWARVKRKIGRAGDVRGWDTSSVRSMHNRVANCNEACHAAQQLGLHVVGIGGKDIADGRGMFILALVPPPHPPPPSRPISTCCRPSRAAPGPSSSRRRRGS